MFAARQLERERAEAKEIGTPSLKKALLDAVVLLGIAIAANFGTSLSVARTVSAHTPMESEPQSRSLRHKFLTCAMKSFNATRHFLHASAHPSIAHIARLMLFPHACTSVKRTVVVRSYKENEPVLVVAVPGSYSILLVQVTDSVS